MQRSYRRSSTQSSQHLVMHSSVLRPPYISSLIHVQQFMHYKAVLLDNVRLITSILYRIQLSEQGKSVCLYWTPIHVGIEKNEMVDRAAKESLQSQPFTTIKPSISQVKTTAKNIIWNRMYQTLSLGTSLIAIRELDNNRLRNHYHSTYYAQESSSHHP